MQHRSPQGLHEKLKVIRTLTATFLVEQITYMTIRVVPALRTPAAISRILYKEGSQLDSNPEVQMLFKKFLLSIFFISATVNAQTTQSASVCDGLFGATQAMCYGRQEARENQRAEQQQLLLRQQIENQRLQNEVLKRKLEQDAKAKQSNPKNDGGKTSVFQAWQIANPWYETDRTKTEYATQYAKQILQESPGISEIDFLNAVSAKVAQVFATGR